MDYIFDLRGPYRGVVWHGLHCFCSNFMTLLGVDIDMEASERCQAKKSTENQEKAYHKHRLL